MARSLALVAVLALLAGSYVSTLAAQTYATTLPSPAAAGFSQTAYNYNMGYVFSTSQSNVTVTHLAACSNDTLAITVNLWDSTSTASPIRTVTTGTASSAGQWRTAALSTPLLLVAGRQYRVAGQFNGSHQVFYKNAPGAPWQMSGVINYVDGCYQSPGTTAAYPVNNGGGWLYGVADIGYSTGPGLSVSATAGSAQTVVSTDLGPSGTGRNIGTFTVSANSSGACTMNSLTLTASGTGNDNNAFSEVGIFEDTNASTVYDAGDVRYGGTFTVYPSDNGALTFSASAAFSASQTRRYFVVVKLNGTTLATNGQTFNTQVTAMAVTGGSSSGTPSTVMNGLVITSPLLTVSATAGTATSHYANDTGGGSGFSIGTFTITNNAVGTGNLASITIAASGSGNDSNAYSNVGLYEDTNSSTVFDAGDTLYGTDVTAFSGDNGTITYTSAQAFNTSQQRRYFVVVKLNGTTLAAPTQTFNTQVSALAVTGTTGSAGTPSTVMNGITITTPTFTYTNTSPASAATAYPSSGNYLLQQFTVNYAAGPSNSITSITLGAQGSGNDLTGYSSVDLYRDANSNSTYDVGVDTLLNTQSAFAADNGALSFTVAESYTPGITMTYFVVVAFNNTVTAGNTFQCRITAGGYGYTGTSSTNLPCPAAFTAGLTIQQPSYTVTNASPGTQGTAYLGGSNYILQGFTIAYSAGPTNTLTGIVLNSSGTGNDQTNYSSVQLYRDSNANATYDVGVDTLVASQSGFSSNNGPLTFTLGGAEASFPATTTRQYFVVVAFNLSGVDNTTFASQLTSLTGTTFGATFSGVPSPTGGPSAGLNLRANNLVATLNGPGTVTTVSSADQGPGGNGLVICDVSLNAINGAWTLNTLTFTANGSGNDATAYNFLALYEDANTNGTFDGTAGGDSLAVAATGTAFAANDGDYVATLVNTTVAATSTRRFFLVGKLAGLAVTGNTFNAALTNTTTVPPAGGSVVGVPTANSTALIVGASALTVTLGPASVANTTVEGGVAFSYTLAQFRFTATNNNVTVNGLTLTNSGSGSWVTHLQVPGVELYVDDGNGTFDSILDTLVFSGAGNVPTMGCTFSTPLTVTNASSKDVWVRVNFAANAGASIPETYRAAIASATDLNITGATPLLGTPVPTSGLCAVVLFNVTSMTPVFDQAAGGSNITLQGSGFLAPLTLSINGVLCPGIPVINANGTQVTGLKVPAGSGTNLVVVLNDGALGAKTLTQTFSYAGGGVIGGGGGGAGGGGGCTTDSTTGIWFAALAFLALTAKLALRRRKA